MNLKKNPNSTFSTLSQDQILKIYSIICILLIFEYLKKIL